MSCILTIQPKLNVFIKLTEQSRFLHPKKECKCLKASKLYGGMYVCICVYIDIYVAIHIMCVYMYLWVDPCIYFLALLAHRSKHLTSQKEWAYLEVKSLVFSTISHLENSDVLGWSHHKVRTIQRSQVSPNFSVLLQRSPGLFKFLIDHDKQTRGSVTALAAFAQVTLSPLMSVLCTVKWKAETLSCARAGVCLSPSCVADLWNPSTPSLAQRRYTVRTATVNKWMPGWSLGPVSCVWFPVPLESPHKRRHHYRSYSYGKVSGGVWRKT